MLLAVAAGDQARFRAAWAWTRGDILQPSGLLAWHWQDGRVADAEPASDADVDTAYALELAARLSPTRATARRPSWLRWATSPAAPCGLGSPRWRQAPVRWWGPCWRSGRLGGAGVIDRPAGGRAPRPGPGDPDGFDAVRLPIRWAASCDPADRAAAAGWAAGHRVDAALLLDRAQAEDRAHPTYYSSAWVALGRVFLQTYRLGTCATA
jgi:endoglucanase